MASYWLKTAEGLLQAVDQTAKAVSSRQKQPQRKIERLHQIAEESSNETTDNIIRAEEEFGVPPSRPTLQASVSLPRKPALDAQRPRNDSNGANKSVYRALQHTDPASKRTSPVQRPSAAPKHHASNLHRKSSSDATSAAKPLRRTSSASTGSTPEAVVQASALAAAPISNDAAYQIGRHTNDDATIKETDEGPPSAEHAIVPLPLPSSGTDGGVEDTVAVPEGSGDPAGLVPGRPPAETQDAPARTQDAQRSVTPLAAPSSSTSSSAVVSNPVYEPEPPPSTRQPNPSREPNDAANERDAPSKTKNIPKPTPEEPATKGTPFANPTDSLPSVVGAAAAVHATKEESTEKGNDKAARLSRLIEGLRRKIDRLESENTQLEEMLAAADAAQHGGRSDIARLEASLQEERSLRTKAETALACNTAAKDDEIASLSQRLSGAEAQVESLTAAVKAAEATRAALEAERSVAEGELLSALRREVEHAEARLEEERSAHAETRRAAAAREHALDALVAEAGALLASIQGAAEERAEKLRVAEERCAALEAEAAGLRGRLGEVDGLHPSIVGAAETHGAFSVSESGDVVADADQQQSRLAEMEETLENARRQIVDAQIQATSAEEEAAQLRARVDALSRQAADARAAAEGDAELRRRLQEVTDALYAKQSQLERAQGERAALAMQLEQRGGGLGSSSVVGGGSGSGVARSEALKRRAAAVDRAFGGSTSYVDEDDAYYGRNGVVPMETLGGAYSRWANAPGHLGGAVKRGAAFLDTTASHAVWLIRHYPLGRLAVFAYIFLMHLFIYVLLHRLQHRALYLHGSGQDVPAGLKPP